MLLQQQGYLLIFLLNIFGIHYWSITGFALTGVIFLKFLNKDIISELPPFILPNTGNMGLPICLFAYGSQGLGIAATISSLVILFHFTLGVFLASKKFDLTLLFRSPPFYAIIISVLFLYFDIETPVFLINTTMMLTYAAIFLILMSLGIALTRFKVFSFKSALISSIARVIIGPIIGFFIIKTFNLIRICCRSIINSVLNAKCRFDIFGWITLFFKKGC